MIVRNIPKSFVLCLVLLMLSACGGGGSGGESESSGSNAGESNTSGSNTGGSNSGGAGAPPQSDPIQQAKQTGNPALLPNDVSELEQRILDTIAAERTELQDLHTILFGNDAISFEPGRNSRFFDLKSFTAAKQVIIGNQGHTFITTSEANDTRTVAIGSNAIVDLNNGGNAGFAQPMVNLLDWLLAPHNLGSTSADNIKVALMLMSNSNMNATQNWLQGTFSNITVTRCTDQAQLNNCLADANLIITGASNLMTEQAVTAALNLAVTNHQSLLYTHDGSWNSTVLTNPILEYFGVSTQAPGSAGNYFSQDAASWTSASQMRTATSTLAQIANLVTRFKNNSFSFNISDCADDNNSCSNVPAYASEFLTDTEQLRNTVKAYDEAATDIFALQDEYPLEKLLILLADQYRQSVTFPMTKTSTDTRQFLRSYFADNLVYSSRQYNPVESDLGNFSRTDFSHITPVSKTVNMVSRTSFRAAGVYALPGQTVSVTRTDNNSGVAVTVFVNTQRSSATQHMAPANGYNRPKYLQSHHMPLATGQTLEFTSPYGGPVQIGFADTGTAVSFQFSNVGVHPYWQTGDNDAAFSAALASNAYDWAEIATEHFELHQTTSKMQQTFSDARWPTPSTLEYIITRHHHNYHKVLSGYQGEDIDVVNEIHDFASANGYSIPTYSSVQHFNGDQQSCGYGCSGNPYDAAWAFEGLGHGDLHEVGHNFESGRFKFNGFEGHATTNFYSYYVKSRAYAEEGYAYNCQSLPFSTMLADLQTSQTQPNPSAYMAARGYSAWNYGVALVIEMMMHAESKGALNNGWHLIPRMHLLEGAFNAADNNDSDWVATRASLGFSLYSRSDALNISNTDWLLVAASYSTGLDYRPFLDLFGLSYSQLASNQVAALGNQAVDKAFYVPASNDGYCAGLTGHSKHSY